jgi:hypothetical protein
MNIINAGNPSANNMIIRQVMQKKRQSSATIFDKLNKRTAKLTAKNPLNNALTNDQLFRYYIQEVEPKLSQSNDNFSGLPNTTPPDNSIKDTTEKDFKDGYNAGSGGGGGGFGPLNSNDITQMTPIPPSTPYIEPSRPPQRAPPVRPTRSLNEYFSSLPWQEQDAQAVDWYNNNRPLLLQLFREMFVDAGGDPTPENIQLALSRFERDSGIVPDDPDHVPGIVNNDPQRIKQEIVPQFIHKTNDLSSIDLSTPPNIPYGVLRKEDAPRTKYFPPDRERQLRDDQERQLHEATSQEWIRKYQLQQDRKIRIHQQLLDLGFDNDDDYPRETQPGDTDPSYPLLNFDNLQAEELLNIPAMDMEAGAADPRIQFWGGNPRFSPQHLPGVSFLSRPEPVQLFNLFQDSVAASSIPSVSNTIVPKDLAVAGGVEKKKKERAPYGSITRTKPSEPDFIAGDFIGNQIVPKPKKKK